jgi:hypothetical protein
MENRLLISPINIDGPKIYMIALIDKNKKIIRLKIGYTVRNIYVRIKEL